MSVIKTHQLNLPIPDPSDQEIEIDGARRHGLIRFTMLTAIATLNAAGLSVGFSGRAYAFSLSDLSQADASSGVKTALEKGAEVAVSLLGKQDGFWGNDLVRIPLPDWIQKTERAIKLIGRGGDIDALKLGVNRAAEQAVPESKALLVGAVKSMSVDDAKGILTGGNDSATQFFKGKTSSPLGEKFLPIVTGVTDRIGLARQYNELAGRVQKTGLIQLKPEQSTVERHVTTKALDGLYFMIGEQEKKIRQDPVGTGSDILQRVFGSLKR
jgi:Protein of unknown function (DUF4197)